MPLQLHIFLHNWHKFHSGVFIDISGTVGSSHHLPHLFSVLPAKVLPADHHLNLLSIRTHSSLTLTSTLCISLLTSICSSWMPRLLTSQTPRPAFYYDDIIQGPWLPIFTPSAFAYWLPLHPTQQIPECSNSSNS